MFSGERHDLCSFTRPVFYNILCNNILTSIIAPYCRTEYCNILIYWYIVSALIQTVINHYWFTISKLLSIRQTISEWNEIHSLLTYYQLLQWGHDEVCGTQLHHPQNGVTGHISSECTLTHVHSSPDSSLFTLGLNVAVHPWSATISGAGDCSHFTNSCTREYEVFHTGCWLGIKKQWCL